MDKLESQLDRIAETPTSLAKVALPKRLQATLRVEYINNNLRRVLCNYMYVWKFARNVGEKGGFRHPLILFYRSNTFNIIKQGG